MKVAAIGLGSMGQGAARALLKAGHAVTGVDPNPAARAALFGAEGCAPRLAPGAVLVVCATMAPADAPPLAHQSPRSAPHTCSICASVSSGYIGRLNTSCAARLVSPQPAGPSVMRPA